MGGGGWPAGVSRRHRRHPRVRADCWFHGKAPTIRQVASHLARIQAADLAYPIIFSANGGLMDGGHRIAKAWLQGLTDIDAVRFHIDPQPDEIRPA